MQPTNKNENGKLKHKILTMTTENKKEGTTTTTAASEQQGKSTGRGGGGRGGRGRGRGRGRGGRGGRGRGRNQQQQQEKGGSATTTTTSADGDNTKDNNNDTNNNNKAGRGGRGRGRGGGGKNQQNKKQNQQDGQKQGGDGEIKNNNKGKQQQQNKGKDGGLNNNKQQKAQNKQAQQQKNDNKTKNNTPTNKKASSSSSQQQQHQPLAPSIPPSQPQQTSDINYGKNQSITVLHVAEKPSIAQAIAKGLCSSGDGANYRSKSLPVHEINNLKFPKAPYAKSCRHKVTSVAGHVFSVDFPAKYQNWDAVDPAELFDAEIIRKPTKGSTVKHLQDESRGVDFIVLWMDCDREGENINYETLDCCMHLMKSSSNDTNYARVYRAHFSAINPSDIKKAYESLGKPDKNQALSVDARQELDLKVGVAFSRFQTRYFQGRYGDLDSSVLSYGPCQTPTMGFCVQRHIDIETFKPEPYWVLELGIMKRGRRLRALWDSGRSFNRNKVETLQSEALSASPAAAVVKNVVTKEKKQGRPVPLNTVALLKACSKALGIGPHGAMQSAERLYLSGYLSYPRTESSAYPKSFDIAGALRQQTSDGRWGNYVSNLLREGHNKSRGGVDMGDHPPITPCRSAGPNELSGDMARVYDLVVRHFIASVSQDAVWQSTRVDFAIESLGEKGTFTLRGKQIKSEGFLAVLLNREYGEEANRDGDDDDEDEEDREIPEFNVGELIPLSNSASKSSSSSVKVAVAHGGAVQGTLEMKEKMTTPPSYLTESELISLMEKHGIGTDASIATHIENIQKRNYVTLESGRRLHPSKLGLVLAQGYHQIDSSLVLPRVRSDIEDQCNKIAKGQASMEDVVKRAIELFRNKFDVFVNDIAKMDVLFGSSFSKLEDVGKPFTRCGLTRRYLQYIPGPPQRLYNKYTETVYPLPGGGIVKQWTGRTCPIEGCNFELCMYSVGQPERSFPLCPRCFNDPDWALDAENLPEDPVDREDEGKERKIHKIAGKALTLECPLPDNHPLIEEMAVSPDPDSDGVLILDPHFGPKWRLVSTRAPTIVYLPKCIHKVTILDKKDDVLDVHLMQVEFKADESPLPDKSSKHKCCFPNDEVLQGMVRVFHGSERLKAAPGRGGRGRGRGRGGRGRGRGGRGGRGKGR